MAYTHYWYRKSREFDRKTFTEAVADFTKLLPVFREKKIVLLDLTADGELVRFDGECETFYMARESDARLSSTGWFFEFCKTSRGAYDLAVTAALIVFKHHFGDDIRISSDGEIGEEWDPAIALTSSILGYKERWEFAETKLGGKTMRCLAAKEAA